MAAVSPERDGAPLLEADVTRPSAEVVSASFPDTKACDASLVRINPSICAERHSPYAGNKTAMKTKKMFALEYRIGHGQGDDPARASATVDRVLHSVRSDLLNDNFGRLPKF